MTGRRTNVHQVTKADKFPSGYASRCSGGQRAAVVFALCEIGLRWRGVGHHLPMPGHPKWNLRRDLLLFVLHEQIDRVTGRPFPATKLGVTGRWGMCLVQRSTTTA